MKQFHKEPADDKSEYSFQFCQSFTTSVNSGFISSSSRML